MCCLAGLVCSVLWVFLHQCCVPKRLLKLFSPVVSAVSSLLLFQPVLNRDQPSQVSAAGAERSHISCEEADVLLSLQGSQLPWESVTLMNNSCPYLPTLREQGQGSSVLDPSAG